MCNSRNENIYGSTLLPHELEKELFMSHVPMTISRDVV